MVNVRVRGERGSKGVIVTASASANAGCRLNIIFTINIINPRAYIKCSIKSMATN